MSNENTDQYGVKYVPPVPTQNNAPPPSWSPIKIPNGDGTYSDGIWNGQATKTN